tara:strand:- start:45 stop:194 length:150 start_codon:yes stop_codon:yes gene_type:complete
MTQMQLEPGCMAAVVVMVAKVIHLVTLQGSKPLVTDTALLVAVRVARSE